MAMFGFIEGLRFLQCCLNSDHYPAFCNPLSRVNVNYSDVSVSDSQVFAMKQARCSAAVPSMMVHCYYGMHLTACTIIIIAVTQWMGGGEICK